MKKTPSKYSNMKNKRVKQYTPDIAMQQVAKRIKDHPVPISMTSNIRTWTDKGE